MCVCVCVCVCVIPKGKKKYSFELGQLNDHLFGKELCIRFTKRVFRELPSLYVGVLLFVTGVSELEFNVPSPFKSHGDGTSVLNSHMKDWRSGGSALRPLGLVVQHVIQYTSAAPSEFDYINS